MVRRDGQPVTLGGSKTKSMMLQRMKPSKLQWTQGWRRLNKKMQVDTSVKKRTRKTTKFQRAIVGASVEDVRIVCALCCGRPPPPPPLPCVSIVSTGGRSSAQSMGALNRGDSDRLGAPRIGSWRREA